ncbi:NAD(+) diphosphatase [Terracoccus luteus]|uniref:NAD(+) diphosphatase n=1 Tax=Terracoccus luteus TaxID=53356 RepID=A0A839PRZ4_9MICO|nr:NAD(+) diphosphatase [Terracoccus luteus]MBB2985839.1 NAD+ diphosphatase [Terracoccus luteus]MCP2171491.1 NAD+ diphosphatase [Terracoccus luteus]
MPETPETTTRTTRDMEPETTTDVLRDLALSRGTLDRAGNERRDEGLLGRLLADPATFVHELRGELLETASGDGGTTRLAVRAPLASDADRLVIDLGRDPAGHAHLVVVADPMEPDSADWSDGSDDAWVGLRESGERLGDEDAGIFTTALALANWHTRNTHCPRCGAPTEVVHAGWVRRCTADGSEHYPRTDPAVIMSVIDPDDRLLLGRAPHWPEGRFSVLAGFVEPGESFEAAVAREVREEVGVVVDDARYLGNQPWPFPASVMVGFTARTSDPTLVLDPVEMAEARWVSRDEYRAALRADEIRTPSGISIAKRLIEHWLGHPVEDVGGRTF